MRLNGCVLKGYKVLCSCMKVKLEKLRNIKRQFRLEKKPAKHLKNLESLKSKLMQMVPQAYGRKRTQLMLGDDFTGLRLVFILLLSRERN